MSVDRRNADLRMKSKKQKKTVSKKTGRIKRMHAEMGKISCYLASASFLILCTAVLIAYMKHGAAAVYIGGLGACSFVLALAGISASIKGRREKDKRQLTCNLGLILNIIMLVGLLIIYMI